MTNSGVGLGLQLPWQLGLVVLAAWMILRYGRWRTGELLVLTGGGLNLIERLMTGFVNDYLQLWGLWFNLPDLLITAGCLLYILSYVQTRNTV